MGNVFKFLLALSLLFTGGIRKGLAVSESAKAGTAFSLSALANPKSPICTYYQKAVPALKRGHLQVENIFHEDLLALEEDDDTDPYQKLLASLPAALPAAPFIDLHLAPGFFHKPRKLLALRNRNARAYAGKPVYVLFGTFLI